MNPIEKLARAQALISAAMYDVGQSAEPVAGEPAAPDVVFGDFRLSARSLERLEGVHVDMRAVVEYAIRVSPVDFGIPKTGGLRDIELQGKLMDSGKSKTLRSRHLTGHAVDIYAYVDGAASWHIPHVMAVHGAFEQASEALAVPLRWGGDWDRDGQPRERGEDDLVHHELPRGDYGTDSESRSELAAAFLRGLS